MNGRRFWGAIAVACLGSAGCLSTDPGSTQAVTGVLTGRITKTDGTGVGFATLGVQLETVPVNGVAQILTSGALQAAADGSYVVNFLVYDQPEQPARVRLSITPPIGSQLLALDTADIPINLHDVSPPTDTAWVFVELQPR